jgi:hypothetical protein
MLITVTGRVLNLPMVQSTRWNDLHLEIMAAIEITIRPLRENDLPDADRIFRLAFGAFIGLPDPLTFAGDADLVRTRWLADPFSALGAESTSGLSFMVWRCSDQKIKGITGLMFTFLTIGVNVALLIVSIIFSTPICKQALSLRNDYIFEVESFMSQ